MAGFHCSNFSSMFRDCIDHVSHVTTIPGSSAVYVTQEYYAMPAHPPPAWLGVVVIVMVFVILAALVHKIASRGTTKPRPLGGFQVLTKEVFDVVSSIEDEPELWQLQGNWLVLKGTELLVRCGDGEGEIRLCPIGKPPVGAAFPHTKEDRKALYEAVKPFLKAAEVQHRRDVSDRITAALLSKIEA